MYEVRVSADFAAAHFLRDYNGKCESLHGHNYKVYAHVRGSVLNEGGMLMDFSLLKGALKSVCERLDHKNLNDIPYFEQNPSAERIAFFIYGALLEELKSRGLDLSFPQTLSAAAPCASATSTDARSGNVTSSHCAPCDAFSTLCSDSGTTAQSDSVVAETMSRERGKDAVDFATASSSVSPSNLKKRTWLYAVDVFETETSRARYIAD